MATAAPLRDETEEMMTPAHRFKRVSVIGLAAEVYVCRRLADETGGSYGVALDAGHLRALAFYNTSYSLGLDLPKESIVTDLLDAVRKSHKQNHPTEERKPS